MDEEEELYRLMDEEDDFYMGDREEEYEDYDDYESGAEYAYCSNSSQNAGCLLLPFIIALMTLAVVVLVM